MAFGMLATAGCSSRQAPTAPASQGQTSAPAGPTATFSLSIDGRDSQEALAAVSEVSVDATASTGTGLRFRIDFGDGTTTSEPLARHVYGAPGTYRVTVAVSDERDRSANAARDLVVASTVGTWVHAGYLASIGRVEVRSVRITTQTGSTVSGILTKDSAGRTPFTGSIRRDRQIRLALDGTSEVLEGVVPSILSADGVEWALSLQGRSTRAESLVFKRVVGEPSGPGPDADLRMRFFSFAAPYAIKQISPVLFDGSASRGDGLSYFIEFGDGQVANVATATHPIEQEGPYQARLTVVDRFGRSDSESVNYLAWSLVGGFSYYWLGRTDACPCLNSVDFYTQEGTLVTGSFSDAELPDNGRFTRSPFTGTVTAKGDVKLALTGSDVRLTGTLTLGHVIDSGGTLRLTFRGGPRDGVTIALHPYTSY